MWQRPPFLGPPRYLALADVAGRAARADLLDPAVRKQVVARAFDDHERDVGAFARDVRLRRLRCVIGSEAVRVVPSLS